METGLGEIDARLAAKSLAKPRKTPRDKPRFPSHLERVEEVLEPEIPPGFEGKERVKIGEDESFRLDVVRARFRLIVTIRPKYAFKEPAAILQAPAPEHIVEAGLPTEALLAQVAVSKYADGLPLYRQEAIYARDGVELGRSLMAQWMGAVGFHFEPLAAFVLARIREGERIFADETTLPTLDPGAGKTKTAWLWAYARDDTPVRRRGAADGRLSVRGQPIRRLRGAPSRRLSRHPAMRRLFRISQARARPARQRAAARRMLGPSAPPVLRTSRQRRVRSSRRATVEQMKLLWAVEDEVRGQPPEARLAARRATSADIVQALFDLWERELPRISGKSKLAEAIRYARSHRAALLLFLDDGRVEIRLEHCRARDQTPGHNEEKLALRRFRGRRPDMGGHRHHAADLQDERRRSLRLGQADAGAHRQPLAQQRHRGADALELQAPRLNGLCCALTGGDRPTARRRSSRHRSLVRRRSPRRPEEQDHASLGQARFAPLGAEGPAHGLGLHLRSDLPEGGQRRRPRAAPLRHTGNEPAPG